MNTEFFAALDMLEKEKGIPKEYMLEKIEAALIAAYKKEYGNNTNVRVVIDEAKKDVKVYQQKEVVAEVENPETQLSLEEARQINSAMPLIITVPSAISGTSSSNIRHTKPGCTRESVTSGPRDSRLTSRT